MPGIDNTDKPVLDFLEQFRDQAKKLRVSVCSLAIAEILKYYSKMINLNPKPMIGRAWGIWHRGRTNVFPD